MRYYKRPRVGIDLHVVDGKYQGSRTHLIEMTSRVIALSPDIDFFLFLDKPEVLPKLAAEFSSDNVFLHRLPARGAAMRLVWQLPILAKHHELDVLHTQYVVPPFVRCKRLVTIHDILFETHPEFFKPTFVMRSKLLMRYAALHADHVMTVSEFSRGEIERLYGVSPQRISVVYNGVDFDRFSSAGNDDTVLTGRGLSAGNYLLSVGRLEPRKNHRILVEAFAMLGEEAPMLVLVGQRDYWFDDVFEVITRLKLEHRVRIIEDVSDDELPVLYRNAKLFAYPAVAEGFGMPVLEAMAAGVPVIATDCAAISEIAAGAAELSDTTNATSLASSIAKVLHDQGLLQELRTQGIARAKSFTWANSASILRKTYLNLL